jgi:hypothetical protein
MILKWSSEKWDVRCGLDSTASIFGTMTGFCEHENELSGSTIGGEFLDQSVEQI